MPLLSNDSAARWPDTTPNSPVRCFCCPPNVARTMAKLHGWAYSVSDDAVWVNLYGSSNAGDTASRRIARQLHAEDRLSLGRQGDDCGSRQAPDTPTTVMLRVPGWATRAAITVNGKPSDVELEPGSYAAIRRQWSPGDVDRA